ncbi:carotenoid oxygenase family protein [Paraburkholderia caffeinilytica]|uniref:carotenoid oxygenase family protein n=1 Tax=Paraburkholderia caffeinilytica TaxID=1761016 RepID=UPI0038B851E7
MTRTSSSVGTAPLHGAGFQTLNSEVVIENVPTEGRFPDWLSGSLLRNGPAMFEAGSDLFNHHFDGFAMLHRFGFRDGEVSYRNRFLHSRAYQYAVAHGKPGYPVFATRLDPSRIDEITEELKRGETPDVNAGVAFARFAGQHVALTDGSTIPMAFDVETLETKGPIVWADVLQQQDCAGNKVDWFRRSTTAHCQLAPNGDVINYFTQPGMGQQVNAYNFYRIRPGMLIREPIGVVQTDALAYVHAFCVTERHIVFPESPLRSDMMVLRDGGSYFESLSWRKGIAMKLHVLDQATGRLAGCFEVRPSYVMHTINAYDEGNEIVLDVAAYDNGDHVAELCLNPGMRPPGGRLTHERMPELRSHARPVRFRLNLVTGKVTEEELAPLTVELPTIDYSARNGRGYSRFYSTGINNDPEAIFYNQLASVDTKSGKYATWSEAGHFPGEAVFVKRPGGEREDDGVLLSVVLDGNVGRSYLMALDPITLEPTAKAFLPHHMPCGFHGQFVSEDGA